MNNRYEGIDGENIAVRYMREHGMTILERNYSTPQGEIDVIATEGEYLIFCEVKARHSHRMGYAVEAVTPAKITQIVHTADWYLKRTRRIGCDVRFDIAAVDLDHETVDYTKNAFCRNDAGRRNHW